MCVGAAQGALEYAVRYMNERVVGGRPLAELQGLQWKVADMATQLEGARLLLQRRAAPRGPARHAAGARDRDGQGGRQPGGEVRVRRGHPAARRLRLQPRVPVERAYRDIRGLCIGAGTVEIQRNFIGSQVRQGRDDVEPRLAQPARRERSGVRVAEPLIRRATPSVRADVPPPGRASTGRPAARGTSPRSTRS